MGSLSVKICSVPAPRWKNLAESKKVSTLFGEADFYGEQVVKLFAQVQRMRETRVSVLGRPDWHLFCLLYKRIAPGFLATKLTEKASVKCCK